MNKQDAFKSVYVTCTDVCLALLALFIVGLTAFLTYPPFAIELTE